SPSSVTPWMNTEPRQSLIVPDGTSRLTPDASIPSLDRRRVASGAGVRSRRASVAATYRSQAPMVSGGGAAKALPGSASASATTQAGQGAVLAPRNTQRSADTKFAALMIATAIAFAGIAGRPS